METAFEQQKRLERAKKRVKKIKGFYSHLLVYVVINIMIVIINVQNLEPGESYFQYKNFFTLFFWGLGLAVHGLSVFLPDFVLGKNWEERKIKEIMDRDKKHWS
ncbi:2TM domain-containing protein [Hanstruepera flava]|uniref:2TM domain-containing protein n=1 Tax=Hanstruepera flava TaxID=2930218 RepID=UPI002027D9BE|nr:2TM domain-containing protein [Hanstruepera flava]